jgi:hypothetical protein
MSECRSLLLAFYDAMQQRDEMTASWYSPAMFFILASFSATTASYLLPSAKINGISSPEFLDSHLRCSQVIALPLSHVHFVRPKAAGLAHTRFRSWGQRPSHAVATQVPGPPFHAAQEIGVLQFRKPEFPYVLESGSAANNVGFCFLLSIDSSLAPYSITFFAKPLCPF